MKLSLPLVIVVFQPQKTSRVESVELFAIYANELSSLTVCSFLMTRKEYILFQHCWQDLIQRVRFRRWTGQ